ncbi:sugar O-acetyltransferase [Turicibacter sanguinis]|uniref:sugar O-acetyltransferase n=1 Tax=Turicibacter sanguinis TaxID=154288 RepID=UPI0018A9C08A|nr:sugar O-acetyltransferase [Turicibacter sanguinis]MDB8557930.1 sugar O-acetyltransferase [Turicibacter sanguinis]MDB8560704.1 sugar O-acetyltransferase [Turicibacter sanguinis]
MTMRERMAAGQLFTDNCDGLAEERQNAKRRMKAFNETGPDEIQTRIQLMNEMFGKETKAWIEPPFYFCYGYNIEIGEKSYVNFNCQFVDDGKITIGKKVMFGPGVTIATVGHPINPNYREYMYTDAVIIEDNCWIGEGVVICPGVIIGENTVIRAGSVVTKSIPANCVAVGNPCRVLREINEQDLKYYYKNREITVKDLEEEAVCRLKG